MLKYLSEVMLTTTILNFSLIPHKATHTVQETTFPWVLHTRLTELCNILAVYLGTRAPRLKFICTRFINCIIKPQLIVSFYFIQLFHCKRIVKFVAVINESAFPSKFLTPSKPWSLEFTLLIIPRYMDQFHIQVGNSLGNTKFSRTAQILPKLLRA